MTAATTAGLHGESGALTGAELLSALQALACSGTLVLERPGGALVLLLDGGQVAAQHALGPNDPLGSAEVTFHYERHEADALPQLGSRFPRSVVSWLRAVPGFGFRPLPKLLDLASLFGELREGRFGGCLWLAASAADGLVLFDEGRAVVAVFEEDGYVRERAEALRALRRCHIGESEAELRLRALPPFFLRALLGMAAGNAAPAGERFSGLEVSDDGYRYLKDGVPLLRVRAELRGAGARFAALSELPELQLPDEPPGWERQRYQLTLRGRDALNPMTEVALEFRRSFGREGRRLLEQLERGATLEVVAQVLALELSELKPWLGRLEQEGLVRRVEA